jgi:predicted dithiol-disulfide oxidoreductase (DUF899 family)
MQAHNTVSRDEWLKARRDLLAKEKAHLKAHDALARERRALPWVKVDKDYVFDGPNGKETLSDLFAGRSQLIVKHFMLVNHDVMLVAISRAPYPKIAAFHKRMGWPFKWVSSNGNDFNFDYHVSFTEADKAKGKVFYNFEEQPYMSDELPGFSVFTKDESGQIFHTYSVFARGTEDVGTVYGFLDITPQGRNEPPGTNLSHWVRHHDKYEEKADKSDCHG